jgi:predicted dehydrogenase
MKTVKVAIVGIGKMGLLHASILNTIPDVEIVALCDRSFVLRKIVKKLFKTAQVIDDTEKLTVCDINSVYVTTPIPGHFPIVQRLLSDNVVSNIFVEKTLASSFDESRQLYELASTSKGVNMVGYMKRFAVTFAKAKDLLKESVLGDLISLDAYAFSSDFSHIPESKRTASRGGVLSDLGSHIIDLALWLIGDFKIESASLKSIVNEESEDSVDFKVKKSGCEGTFSVSWCMENYRMPSFGLSITGSDGTLRVNDYSLELRLRNGGFHKWFRHELNDYVGFLLGDSEYYREDEAFVNAMRNDLQVEPTFATASNVDRVIDQVKRVATKNVT